MIHLSRVSKWYLSQNRILNEINLELKRGDFIYVVGGSGAGKSSLLRLLATEECPSLGTVSLLGYPLEGLSVSSLRKIRKSLGYIPQNVRLIPDLSVYENIALSLSLKGQLILTKEAKAKISELLHKLGLEGKRNQPAFALSGGEAQRVAVARALVRSPELIIADEPTGAQDRDFTWSLMDLFLKSNLKGATVVLATHDREIVKKLRKKCAVLRNGNISMEESFCTY